MSTCPDIEIHSLYLDNELPENFKAEFESHIASCEKCKAKLEKMKKTHQIFQSDSQNLNLDKVFLDQSFERLQSRMRYAKVIKESEPKSTMMFPEAKKYLPVAIAAAAVFALVLPLGMRTKDSQQTPQVAQVQSIKRTTDFTLDHNELLTQTSNAAYPINLATPVANEDNFSTFTLNSFNPSLDSAAVSVRHRRRSSGAAKLMQDDFFTPDFIHSNESPALQVYTPTYVDISSLNK